MTPIPPKMSPASPFSQADAIAAVRRDLLTAFPDYVVKARAAYQRVADEAAGITDPKEFSAHQTACKSAIGHLESLIKLLRWACDGAEQTRSTEDDNGVNDPAEKLITEARKQLSFQK